MNKEEFIHEISTSLFPVLNDSVYEYILTLIVEHEFEPGQKINMSKLAEDLDISRTPIKIALERLADEGIVKKSSSNGYETRRIFWPDCLSLYQTRELIEGYAAKEAAFKIRSDGIKELEEIISRSKEHAKSQQIVPFLQDDIDFHRTIVKYSGNIHLLDAYDHLKTWIRLYQHLFRAYQTERIIFDNAIEKHTAILKSIKNHFGNEARIQSERHIQELYFDLANLMSSKY